MLSFPGKAIGWTISLFKKDEGPVSEDSLNTFHLTKDEMDAVKALNGRVMCSVDSKSSVVTLSVTMQDPVISALLTDTVMNNLQQYITDYRTNKARNDLEYTQMRRVRTIIRRSRPMRAIWIRTRISYCARCGRSRRGCRMR